MSNAFKSRRSATPALCLLVVPIASLATLPAVAAETTLPAVTVEVETEKTSKETYQATTTRIGKSNQELRDIPQSVTVVTERLIDDRNLDTLKDTLHNTAGISFQAAEGQEEDIRLRGFSLQGSGDIFIDGMRDPAFYERDTFNYDRLEVLRGSASMLFGRGSTGGAVNQVNKEPFLMNQHEVAATIGSGGYARTVGDFNIRTGDDAALRLNAMWTGSDAYGTYGAGLDKKGIAAAYRFGIGTADEFLASIYHLDNHNGIHYGLPWLTPSGGGTNRILVPVDAENYYGAASDYNASVATYGTLSHTHRFKDGGELKTAFRAGHFERDQRASAIRFANAALQPGGLAVTEDTLSDATVLTRGSNNKIQDLDNRLLQSDYSGNFDWFGLKHAVLAGVDLANDEFVGYTTPNQPALAKSTTTIGTPDDGASVDEGARVVLKNRDFDSNALGIYFQDTLQIAPDWKLVAGLRWDSFEGTYRTFSTAAATLGQQTGQLSRSDSLWSKRFGVLYQPTPLASFHFSYGTSFNTSGDTYQYDALGSNTPPEASRNIEIGAKLTSESGNLSTRFAIFHATKYNERNRDEESVSPTNYVLSGRRHASGFEMDIAGRIGRSWEVFLSYAWIPNAKIDSGASDGSTLTSGEIVGTRPGMTPEHSATLWSTYQLDGRWRVGGGLNMRSSMTPLQVRAFAAPSYVTADLMAEYAMARDLAFKLNITNVTDKHYADYLYRGHYVPGALAAALLPRLARAAEPEQQLIATWRSTLRLGPRGEVLEATMGPIDYVGILEPDWEAGRVRIRQALAVPDRVHGLLDAGDGDDGGFIAVAFRPGAWLMRVDAEGRIARRVSMADEGVRTLDGHAVFDPSGQWLITTETDPRDSRGWISVRDRRTLKKEAEWRTHGIEPHQMCLDATGKLVVANGGIRRAAGDRKRDLDQMESSLVRLDPANGELLGQWRLRDSRLSLRHLALGTDLAPNGKPLVGIAIEAEHDDPARRAAAPILAIWDGVELATPSHVPVGKGYSSDIVAGPGGGFYLNAEFAHRVVRWLPSAPAELTVIAELQRARSLATWRPDGENGVLIGALNGIGRWHPTAAPRFMRWPIDMSVDIHWTPKA